MIAPLLQDVPLIKWPISLLLGSRECEADTQLTSLTQQRKTGFPPPPPTHTHAHCPRRRSEVLQALHQDQFIKINANHITDISRS